MRKELMAALGRSTILECGSSSIIKSTDTESKDHLTGQT